MSKKKSFTGNTMTLKDFHGGSIPSDLPLPSAPGVVVRPVDRTGFERQTSWGNPNRSDHRLRPNSSGSMRSLDDKTPFLMSSSGTSLIGRNFDEDERKPLDGTSGPRRTVSDENIHAPVVRSDVRFVAGGVGGGSSYSARVVEGSRPLSGGGGGGANSNAWGLKKDGPVGVSLSPWNGQSTVSKFAQASALDQISSGRWQTKPTLTPTPTHHQADVEVIRQSDSPNSLYGRAGDSYSGVSFVDEKEGYENVLVGDVERGLVVEEGVHGGVKEVSGVERVRSPVLHDGNENNSISYSNAGEVGFRDGKSKGPELHTPPEVSERPKLKLLPRTKPLEVTDAFAVPVDYHKPVETSHSGGGGNNVVNASGVKPGLTSTEASHVKSGLTSNEASRVQPVVANSDAGNRLVERPKLNLKPRSQPLDHIEGNGERKRLALFGGARPREMVLKERGVDDVVKSHEYDEAPSRVKSDIVQPEIAPVSTNNSRHGERIENVPVGHRTSRGNDRRERGDVQKTDMQRKNNRPNENWRNSRGTEKLPHQQQERQPSPETWRKPVDQSKPATSGLRFGKAVSAVELAQAFSRPVSDPKPPEQFSGPRGRPARTQAPFSRLTGPTTRAQINGY